MSFNRFTAALLVAMFGATAPAARCQSKSGNDSIPARFTIGATHAVAGMTNFEFPELDARIAAAGLPAVAHQTASLGIGSDIRLRRLLLGAGFQTLVTRDQLNDAYRTRLAGSYAMLDLGIIAIDVKRWSVTPFAGIGAAHISVNVRERGDFTFDEALARPARELGMSGLTAITHAGLQLTRRFSIDRGDFAIAVRGGVLRSVGSQAWTSDANRVEGGPAGLRGSYVRLMFSRPIRTRRDALVPAAGAVLQTVAW